MKGKKQKEPVGFNPAEIFAALELLEKERGIPQSFMLDKIIQALTTAYKRDHDGVENVIVDVDEVRHTMKMFVQKNVVAEEDYVDPANEILVEEAKHISARYEVGDIINLPVDTVEFGRIAAGNGKQVIIQGLREAERGMVYDEFNSKQHEILTGVVTRIDPRNGAVTLRISSGSEFTDAYLGANEQVKGETFQPTERVKVYILEVKDTPKGPRILVSRTHPGLVKRLFESEVAEVRDGTVEIKSIAREAGSRTKIAVWSNDPDVDAVGACVGMNGARVGAVVNELHGEKIDIINWDENPAILIENALSPAKVIAVMADPDEKTALVVVPDYQLSLAIGKEGQNARLAARLTGFKIDIKSETQARESGDFYDDYDEEHEEAEEEMTEEAVSEEIEEAEEDTEETETEAEETADGDAEE